MFTYDFDSGSKDTDDRELEATRITPDRYPNQPQIDDRINPPYEFRHEDRERRPRFPFDFDHDDRDRRNDHRPYDPPFDFEHGAGRRDDRRPGGPPPSAAPSYTKSANVYAVDPGAISGCLYRYTYVWLSNGRSFWFFPTYVGRKSISGYRWSNFGWSYIGLDLDLVDFFKCSGY